jgi:hypothetical protein
MYHHTPTNSAAMGKLLDLPRPQIHFKMGIILLLEVMVGVKEKIYKTLKIVTCI